MPYYKYRREIPTKKKRKKTILGMQLLLICMILVFAFMMDFTGGRKTESVSMAPYSCPLQAENFYSVQIGVYERENLIVQLQNKSESPLYCELYVGEELVGDCIDSSTAQARNSVHHDFDSPLEPGIYTFLFYNDGSAALEGNFSIQYKDNEEESK